VVNLVNKFVVNVANKDLPPMQADKDSYYNQWSSLAPLLFFPNMTERACDALKISLKGAPTISSSLHFDLHKFLSNHHERSFTFLFFTNYFIW